MKALTMVVLLVWCLAAAAQNVGINKTNPGQPLDVNGNVNVDGKILVNGVQGATDQVLVTTSTGATAWANMGNFSNVRGFTQTGTFTVPAGITRIMVEGWGAGGGGSSGGGGAAGMYIQSIQTVTPGQVLTITTGTGGAHATTTPGLASDGTQTTITGSSPFISLTAAGGKGAFNTAPGYATRFGISGGVYIQSTGESGEANTLIYAQKNSTTFTIIRKYGDGGAAPPGYNMRSQGETISFNENTGAVIEANNPTFAPFPGGGGGGGLLGEDGAAGMVNIWY